MALPIVAIIGRPNVGKSSLLNALAGRRISIVEPTAGVTRDRISAIIERNERYFELVDTGGYGIVDSDKLSNHIERQILQAIESADVVVFMVDIRDSLVPLDEKIAALLRKEKMDVILTANKADTARLFPSAAEFNKLGLGEPICISALNNLNKSILLDEIVAKISHLPDERPEKAEMKIAVVGKRNAGKSTLINVIVGGDRVIVSEIPGTTRDAVDVRFRKNGKTFIAIDTAGIRKKRKIADDIGFYSYARATRSIRRADVVLFLIDASVPVSQVDKKLANFITEQYKCCVLVINKWDLAKDTAVTGDYEDYLTKLLPGLKYAPIAFTTATEGKNVKNVLNLAAEIFKQATMLIPTGKLNKAFETIKAESVGAVRRGKSGWPKIYYATQIAARPVTILMFVNRPELFEENYRRYIINRLRELLPIAEVPIRLLLRKHR
jgi:GTP-binding protein